MSNYNILITEIKAIAALKGNKSHSEIVAFCSATINAITGINKEDPFLIVESEIRDLILFYLYLIRARNLTHKQRSLLADKLLQEIQEAEKKKNIKIEWEDIPF